MAPMAEPHLVAVAMHTSTAPMPEPARLSILPEIAPTTLMPAAQHLAETFGIWTENVSIPWLTEMTITSAGDDPTSSRSASGLQPCTNDDFTFGLYGIVAGFVCILGLVGNTVSICVLIKDLKTPVASFQLVTLAAADNLFLVLWFVHYTVRFVLKFCGVVTGGGVDMTTVAGTVLTVVRLYTFPVLYMAQTATIWLTVVIAFNRYMAVCWPYKAPRLHKIHIVYREVIAVTVLTVVYNLPRFFEWTVSYNSATNASLSSSPSYANVTFQQKPQQLIVNRTSVGRSQIYRIVYNDTLYYLLSFALPLVVLAAMNTCVIRAYRAARMRRRRMSSNHQPATARRDVGGDGVSEVGACTTVAGGGSGFGRYPTRTRCRRADHESSVTLVMIVIVLVFIGCQAPARVVQIVWGYIYSDCRQIQYYLIHISNTLEVFNSSLNFVVYCTFHRHFRTVISGWLQAFRRTSPWKASQGGNVSIVPAAAMTVVAAGARNGLCRSRSTSPEGHAAATVVLLAAARSAAEAVHLETIQLAEVTVAP